MPESGYNNNTPALDIWRCLPSSKAKVNSSDFPLVQHMLVSWPALQLSLFDPRTCTHTSIGMAQTQDWVCGKLYALTVQAIQVRLAQLFLKPHPSNICNGKDPDIDSFVHASIPEGWSNSSRMASTLKKFYSNCSTTIISCLCHSSTLLILSMFIQ